MSTILFYYVIFALTTALYCWIKIFMPVRQMLTHTTDNHDYVVKPILASIIFIIFCFVVAPLMVFAVFSQDLCDQVIDGVYESAL